MKDMRLQFGTGVENSLQLKFKKILKKQFLKNGKPLQLQWSLKIVFILLL